MISDLTKSILIKATTSQAVNKSANGPSTLKTQQTQAGIGAWHGGGDRESEDADNEGCSESESEHQQISTNTSFEMNDEDFNKLWES